MVDNQLTAGQACERGNAKAATFATTTKPAKTGALRNKKPGEGAPGVRSDNR
jgi:hypothetical protein